MHPARQVHRPVYHMLTSFAEIYSFAAGGQVHCGFVAALYPGSLEACVKCLQMYLCDSVLLCLNLDLSYQLASLRLQLIRAS
jgi:hypothetical protein